MTAVVRVGIGGWTFEPWRGVFYPTKHPQARELEYASRQVTAIEINGTYYSGFGAATFAKWREATPDDFTFTVKANRFCTNRKRLADAGPSIEKFFGQGLAELGGKLGPILWQFMPTKRFDPEDFAAFLDLLPSSTGGLALRHAVEVRHPSFLDPAFVDLARARGVAIVYADSAARPQIADLTSSFVYARLQDAHEDLETGYDAAAIARFATLAHGWATGGDPADLPHVGPLAEAAVPRDVYLFVINGAKVRAPAAARALLASLVRPSPTQPA